MSCIYSSSSSLKQKFNMSSSRYVFVYFNFGSPHFHILVCCFYISSSHKCGSGTSQNCSILELQNFTLSFVCCFDLFHLTSHKCETSHNRYSVFTFINAQKKKKKSILSILRNYFINTPYIYILFSYQLALYL